MSDIVERLDNAADNPAGYAYLVEEAAAEIERLRALLAECAALTDEPWLDNDQREVLRRAKAALTSSPPAPGDTAP